MEHLPQFRAILSVEWIHLAQKQGHQPNDDLSDKFSHTIDNILKSFRGHLINNGVPTFVCVFPSVFEGILASIELQKACRNLMGSSTRIGLHYGPVDTETGLLNDETIGVAVQIQSLGTANSVIISTPVFDQIQSHPQFKAKPIGKFEISGLPGLHEIFVLFGFGLNLPSNLGWMGRIKATLQKANVALQAIF